MTLTDAIKEAQERYTITHEPTPPGSVDALLFIVVDHETGERYPAGNAEHHASALRARLIEADRNTPANP